MLKVKTKKKKVNKVGRELCNGREEAVGMFLLEAVVACIRCNCCWKYDLRQGNGFDGIHCSEWF